MSKELEALKYFKSAYNGFLKTTNDMFCQITISREQANEFVEEVEVVEKKVKALEIIKTKRVDVFELLLGISNSMYRNPLERYNSYVEGSFNTELTPQEFDLLKEVLE